VYAYYFLIPANNACIAELFGSPLAVKTLNAKMFDVWSHMTVRITEVT